MDVKKTKRIVAGLVAAFLLWGPVFCFAGSETIQDFRLWTPVYLNFPISGPVKGYLEANPRLSDDASQINQLLLRPAIGYQLTSTISLWQGYAWVANYQPSYSQEHRIFQQLIYNNKFSTFTLFSRSRLEERWIQHAIGTAVRARTMLRGTFPLPASPALAIAVYDEIFVNLNTIRQGPEAGFEQNRFFLGLNYTFSPNLNVDAGYQLQIINTPLSGTVNQANHILLLQFFINL
ncbi:DUF2490 domain-containing protein [Nitrospira sp. Ecomares 2.1]